MVKPTNASVEPYRLIYRVRHKHLTVFKILKSECPQCAASILTVTIYSDVWSLVEMERWSVHHRIAAVELVIATESITDCAVSANSYKDMMLLAVLWVSKLCQEGLVKESKPQGRTCSARTPYDLTMWSQ